MATQAPHLDVAAPSLRHRAAWTMADQALSSLTNAALSIVVARSVTTSAFGAFSVALVTFSFVIGVNRAVVSDPLVIRFTAAPAGRLAVAVREASGAALSLGVGAGLLCGLAGFLLPNREVGSALVALAVTLPGLLVQDTWRFGFFAAGRPRAAAVNDLVWAVVQFTAVGLLLAAGSTSVILFTLAWGGAALVAAAVGCLQLRVLPGWVSAGPWFAASRELSTRLGADYVLNMGAVNGATYGVGAIANLAAVGSLRAAQVVLGPLQLAFAGITSFVLPVFSHRVADRRSLALPALLVSAAVVPVAAAWVAVLVMLPHRAGVELLGDTWDGAHDVMLPVGVVMVCTAAVIGASIGLKALGRADLLLAVGLVQSPLIVALAVLGAFQDGAHGAAVGLAAAQAVGTLVCWVLFRRALVTAARARSGRPVE